MAKPTKNQNKIANKLKALIKKRIKDLGLIDTGALYDSIEVWPDGNYNFDVTGELYLKFLDGGTDRGIRAYHIIDYVVNSDEFINYVAEEIASEINVILDGDETSID